MNKEADEAEDEIQGDDKVFVNDEVETKSESGDQDEARCWMGQKKDS